MKDRLRKSDLAIAALALVFAVSAFAARFCKTDEIVFAGGPNVTDTVVPPPGTETPINPNASTIHLPVAVNNSEVTQTPTVVVPTPEPPTDTPVAP